METNQIKKFAQEARKVLQTGIWHKLALLGFSSDGNVPERNVPVEGGDHIVFMGRVITDMSFYTKWTALRTRIEEKGIKEVVEEAAYTWFNRLVAVRIMVKNGFSEPVLEYQSEQIRVPRIVADARRGIYPTLTETDRAQLITLLDDDSKTTEQFTLLIVSFCRFNPVLAACFGGINDYTELLLPANILADGGFIDLLNHTEFITDDDFRQSELIGWLYQFYISEKKDEVFASFKNKKKAEADDIPAATQIFTPNWIVKYMVQNTVGRIYLDNNPYATDIKEQMKYLVEPVEPTPAEAIFRCEDIHSLTVADLACGSGHILNEAFDLLYSIYVEEGYNRRKAIEDIFRFNLLGVDLDTRAKQLAMFALLIKACQKDNSFLDAHCLPRVLDMSVASKVRRLNTEGGVAELLTEFFAGANKELITETLDALVLMEQADNLGSIMKFGLSEATRTAIAMRSREWEEIGTENNKIKTLLAAFDIVLALTDKYAALVMNPPYMGSGNMNAGLSDYVKRNYPDGKADLFSVFMLLAKDALKPNGKYGMINMQSWMFLSSFESLRINLLKETCIESMLHLGPRTFDELSGEVVQNTAFVITNSEPTADTCGTYYRLIAGGNCHTKETMFLDPEEIDTEFAEVRQIFFPNINQSNFEKIPGSPIGYWATEKFIKAFNGSDLSKVATPRAGMITGNNNRFVRFWFEIENNKFNFSCKSIQDSILSKCKWFPYQKGGTYRKWAGNNEFVVNYENNGWLLKNTIDNNGKIPAHAFNEDYIFKSNVNWSAISSFGFSTRITEYGKLFDASGSAAFPIHENDLWKISSFLNSKVANEMLKLINPTVNFQAWEIGKLPYESNRINDNIIQIIQNCYSISKFDWDAHETSWDFQCNEIVALDSEEKYIDTINSIYEGTGIVPDLAAPQLDSLEWRTNIFKEKWEDKFRRLHGNEEELNRLFINIYDLQDELTPNVPISEITILQQGEISIKPEGPYCGTLVWHDDVLMKQFISYAVGCMMGRYRLDKPGLHIAHPNPTDEEVCSYEYNGRQFAIDDDAIIPLMSRESAFNDNASDRFKEFLKVTLGEDTLTENLNFIEAALGKDIETYFVKDFWKDHLVRYQRRPIYWLFTSKKGAFQCLVYMHRMNPYTAEQIRTKYLLPHIEYLGTRIAEMEQRAASLTTKERKMLDKLQKDLEECREYHDRLHLVADRQIDFDLDDGVVVNYAKFGDVLAKLK